jgi:hypothetical protein
MMTLFDARRDTIKSVCRSLRRALRRFSQHDDAAAADDDFDDPTKEREEERFCPLSKKSPLVWCYVQTKKITFFSKEK